ncbi:MarR family transcriptional regulator [uncultured Brachyspira sp.]|uniref:MarR family winged helix-turn-helix transcriptional regulator n=1 Tax=uncultured Brachyspira sp. TaxID=221953 RepID=UPI0026342E9C|nr:MarR family transcriptional regulator [uncultured Brachyspira sp.]
MIAFYFRRIYINTNIGYEVCYTARKIYQYIGKQINEFNITPEQLVVIKELYKEEGISQKELSIRLDKDQNTVKAIIDKLEKKSLVKRNENKSDKRAFSLFLTDKAKNDLMEIEVYENKVVEQITKGIDKENADKFMSILEQIRKNIIE